MQNKHQKRKRKRLYWCCSRHHVIPKSRLKIPIGIDGDAVYIPKVSWYIYRKLFGKRSPREARRFLIKYFWGGGIISSGYRVVIINHRCHVLYHKLFENMTPPEILQFLAIHYWGGYYK